MLFLHDSTITHVLTRNLIVKNIFDLDLDLIDALSSASKAY